MKKLFLFAFASLICLSSSKNNAPLTPQDTAVILVDLQYDFTELPSKGKARGSLAVPGANQAYVNKVQKVLTYLKKKGFYVIGTKDWHPKGHVSFASTHPGAKAFETIKIDNKTNKKAAAGAKDTRAQTLWPDHCVQGSEGAEIVKALQNLVDQTVTKGTRVPYDSYSGFEDDEGTKTALDQILKELQGKQIKNLVVFGLATDYCVSWTAQHGAQYQYNVFMIEDLSKGIAEASMKKAREEMKQKGVTITAFEALKKQIK